MDVRKRDGMMESFDYGKIVESIKKAAVAVEYQDQDMQRKIEEVRKLKRKLIGAGYKP